MTTILTTAQELHTAGISAVPVRADGSKAPVPWDARTLIGDKDITRFWEKVNISQATECWEFTGAVDNYGRFWWNGHTGEAHRFAWVIANGDIPKGLHIDHLCRNRRCVNPKHLEPVTLGTNVLRGDGITAHNKRKTHCLRGHPLSGHNLYTSNDGNRHCRACAVARTKQWREWKRKNNG